MSAASPLIRPLALLIGRALGLGRRPASLALRLDRGPIRPPADGDRPGFALTDVTASLGVDFVHRRPGLDPVRVVAAASTTPAALLGLGDRGALATGLRADLVVLDDDWQVSRVMRGGAWVG